jgi:hypothetical protein
MTRRNPENPFVLDELYFANLTVTSPQRTIFHHIHLTNRILPPLIGTFLTFLLYYLFRFRTPPLFRPYTKMFTLTLGVDFFVMVMNFLFQTVNFVELRTLILVFQHTRIVDGFLLLSAHGPFYYLGYQTKCSLEFIQDISWLIGFVNLPVQLYYRLRAVQE